MNGRIAVLGGGFQGCCIALELASRGIDVLLVDENEDLLTRTAVANEGKVHLGYMYAADPTLSTARTMMRGALAFAPFLRRHLGEAAALDTSVPAVYVVHRDSQHDADQVAAYLAQVHREIQGVGAPEGSYFHQDLGAPMRRWSDAELASSFDPELVSAAFTSPEVAIDPLAVARLLRDRIAEEPRIEVLTGHHVDRARRRDRGGFEVGGSDWSASADQVVNALWAGRISFDRRLEVRPDRRWLHRLKYGVSLPWPVGASRPPSATVISGPFGEVVSYPDSTTYLTWYPTCVRGYSEADSPPPAWGTPPTSAEHAEIVAGTVAGLAGLVPALRGLTSEHLQHATVKGGVIVAWGETDIDDPDSELHERFRIGVRTDDGHHSVDPGKLTMAPWFAMQCADRVTSTVAA